MFEAAHYAVPEPKRRSRKRGALGPRLPPESPCVLVVDDDLLTLKIMTSAIEKRGWLPVCVPDGESGLNAAARDAPDVVVLDLLMPGMDGFQFLHRLREAAGGQDVPVVVYTGKELTREDLRDLKAFAHAVVPKGQSTSTVLDAAGKFLERGDEGTG